VDHLVKQSGSSFERIASYEEHSFPSLCLAGKEEQGSRSVEQLSLKQAWQRTISNKSLMNDREAQASSQLHIKLALPLLCLLVVIASAPWCLRFRRHFPLFLLYSVSIALFLAFFTCMDAALILSESRLFSPALALWTPLFISTAIFGWRYSKL
jgi:lipopolysaccharide export system permease protein